MNWNSLWRELAARLGLQFHPGLAHESFVSAFPGGSTPRHLIGPSEGTLDDESLTSLVAVLGRAPSQRCFFRFFATSLRDYTFMGLHAGRIDELDELLMGRSDGVWDVLGGPEYWWPEDHSWCVCSDWDMTSTIVGGSESLIARVLVAPGIEALRVSADTRLDAANDRRVQAR